VPEDLPAFCRAILELLGLADLPPRGD